MDDDKKAKLEAAGWKEVSIEEFLGGEIGESTEEAPPFNHATFTVAIDDGYCKWTYAFGLPSSTCIQDVVEAIADAFGAEAPEGKLSSGYCE